jgi:hypothetical protein
MEKAREVDQTQRRLERDIRRYKAEGHLLKGVDDKHSNELYKKARGKTAEYREYSKENDAVAAYMYRTQVGREEQAYNEARYAKLLDTEQKRVYDTVTKDYEAKEFEPVRLTEHFNKHNYFKYKSESEYQQGAKEFLQTPVDGERYFGYTRKNGEVVIYDNDTNTFSVGESNGTIGTYFKPDEGVIYYLRDLGRHLPNDK